MCTPTAKRARKPRGFWADLGNVRSELDAHARETGASPGVMPTAAMLRGAGRRDIDNAITKAGGYTSVATALGFAGGPAAKRKPHGYWNSFENVSAELNAFLDEFTEDGARREMPTLGMLRAAKRVDLEQGIENFGGFRAVAEQLFLERASMRKSDGYWVDFAVVETELRNFVKERNQPTTPDGTEFMPSQSELRAASRSDLAQAIAAFHGGYAAVASKLGYKSLHKDWSQFYALAAELFAFVREKNNNIPMMPSTAMLRDGKRADLLGAITKFGGAQVVAERLGLQYVMRTREAFRSWPVFHRAIVSFAETHGTKGQVPSSRELRNFGRNDLYVAITGSTSTTSAAWCSSL
jgi:hypothetical protein